jgi:hypothetical protein
MHPWVAADFEPDGFKPSGPIHSGPAISKSHEFSFMHKVFHRLCVNNNWVHIRSHTYMPPWTFLTKQCITGRGEKKKKKKKIKKKKKSVGENCTWIGARRYR